MPIPTKNSIQETSIDAGGNVRIGDTIYNNYGNAAQEVRVPHHLTNLIPTNADRRFSAPKYSAFIIDVFVINSISI